MQSEAMIRKAAEAIWAIRREEEDRCDMTLDDIGGEESSVWQEAKAAAQADYEARIRSALSAQVQDVAGWKSEVTHEGICNTHEGGPCNCDWSAADEDQPHPDDIAVDRFATAMKAKLAIAICMVIVLAIIASCARPQPYGEDIWLGLEHVNQRNKEVNGD